MKPTCRTDVTIALLLIGAVTSTAAVRYVDAHSLNPTPPFTSWDTAAGTIQDAVDAADDGDQILVTNGVYDTGGRIALGSRVTNRVAVTKPLTLQSVHGAGVTTIVGYQVPGNLNGDTAIRCALLMNGASMTGFTLTGGATETDGNGGGVYCPSNDASIAECVITMNSAYSGGGVSRGTYRNCWITSNQLDSPGTSGGGASGATLADCTIAENSANTGGGIQFCRATRCVISANAARVRGGGASGSECRECTLIGNTSQTGGGAYGGLLVNCLILSNSVSLTSGMGGGVEGAQAVNSIILGNSALSGAGALRGVLRNCTVVSNHAVASAGGTRMSVLTNCIVYFNTARTSTNYDNPLSIGSLVNCCTVPLPPDGSGNITLEPRFLDLAAGDLRLQSNSPCINAGLNAAATTDPDLAGRARIAGGTVDIGAYEAPEPTSMLSYGWLQQFQLPIDGSADFSDHDGDGLNNWQEWSAGTIPTNALSTLRLFPPVATVSGMSLTWLSVSNRAYFLERSTNLTGLTRFAPIFTNISGHPVATGVIDTDTRGGERFFYRVGVH